MLDNLSTTFPKEHSQQITWEIQHKLGKTVEFDRESKLNDNPYLFIEHLLFRTNLLSSYSQKSVLKIFQWVFKV
jgi:hypothetical protein